MQEVVINVRVKDNEVEDLRVELEKLGFSFDEVDGKVKNLGDKTKDQFSSAQDSASNLRGGVEGIGQEFIKVGKAAKKGGAAIKSALISTGVGALIVALGLIIDNWEAIAEAVGLVNKDIERQNELLSIQAGVADAELIYLKNKVEFLKQIGASQEEIDKAERELAVRRFERQKELREQLQNQLNLYKELKKEADTDDPESIKKAAEAYQKLLAIRQEQFKLEQEIFEAGGVTVTGAGGDKDKDSGESPEAQVRDTRVANELETITALAEVRMKEVDIEASITEGLEAEAEKRRLIRNAEVEFAKGKNDVIFDTASRLQDALFALGEENKAFAVAGIVVEQVAGAASAIQNLLVANTKAKAFFPLTSGQPFVAVNTISTLAGIAAGAAAASKAISQIGGGGDAAQTPSLGGGGGSAAQAPSFNLVGSSGISQLSQQLNQDQEPIQAFVVASAVTSQQELDQNIVDGATID